VTAALIIANYAVVGGNAVGWLSIETISLIALSLILLGVFLVIESRVKAPLMPLRLFRLRNIATANVVAVLWAAAMFAWFFISALYMQLVLGYTPLQVGLAFLPSNAIMAVFSLGLSARIVMRFGIKLPLTIGLALAALGLALFSQAPVAGHFVADVLPGMVLLGIGAGIAFNPMLLAAMNDATEDESGLASGLVNTYVVHDGWCLGTRHPRVDRRVAYGASRLSRSRRTLGAHRRLPDSILDRCALCGLCGDHRGTAHTRAKVCAHRRRFTLVL
jgi:hypothetical protein